MADAGAPLELPACTAGDAGEWTRWSLAEGLTPSLPVDYIADRSDDETLSEVGAACATAEDRALCERDLNDLDESLHTFHGFWHLVTTNADGVRLWPQRSALALLTPLDTPAEAIWLIRELHSPPDCDAAIRADGDDFLIDIQMENPDYCIVFNPDGTTSPVGPVTMRVSPDGTVSYDRNDSWCRSAR
ncbi:MAG: hypothetical protein ABW321_27555 [Polyangiales bacterium]